MAVITKHLLKGWTQNESGGSGTWLWVRRIGDLLKPEDLVDVGGELPIISMEDEVEAPTYLFIEIQDMVDACGRDMLGQLNLAGEVYLVEPSRYSARDLKSAFESCGGDGIKDLIEEFVDSEYTGVSSKIPGGPASVPDIGLLYADFLRSYGKKARLHSTSGGRIVTEKNLHDGVDEGSKGFSQLLRELLTEANQYATDNVKLETTLDTRVVNKLGETARQCAGGIDSHWDTLRSIQAKGDKATREQKLYLKMTMNSSGQTLGGDIVPLDIMTGGSDG